MDRVTATKVRPTEFSKDSLNTLYLLFAIFWWVGLPPTYLAIGLPLLIAAIVLACIILYRHWQMLQDHTARTTPGMAVGLCFVPLFNFYWGFVADGAYPTRPGTTSRP